jgi:hypothetical protein
LRALEDDAREGADQQYEGNRTIGNLHGASPW